MATGRVKWFSEQKGYGFLTTDEGEDVFVHYSAIRQGHDFAFRELKVGQQVSFDLVDGPKGLIAVGVDKE